MFLVYINFSECEYLCDVIVIQQIVSFRSQIQPSSLTEEVTLAEALNFFILLYFLTSLQVLVLYYNIILCSPLTSISII